MNLLSKLLAAWRQRKSLGDSKKSIELAAFLPAALEIQETPPNPLVRWLARALIALVVLAIVWACIGEVNVVATAEGKIIPSARVKQIQPLQKGVIKAIHVSEGDQVKKRQPLIELDTVLTSAEENRLAAEIQALQMRRAVNQNLIGLLNAPEHPMDAITLNELPLEYPDQLEGKDKALYSQLLWQQWLEYKSQAQSLQSSLAQIRAQQAASAEIIEKLSQTLPLAEKRKRKLQQLYDKEYVAELDLLEAQQEHIRQRHDLAAEKQRLKQLQAAEQEAREQINLFAAQTSGRLLSEIAEYTSQVTSLSEELNKARDIDNKHTLYAPISGQVQELAVNTVGGVVTDAQQLMLIVPDEEKLEVEVFLENKDIGFVQEGMAAEVKIHTFPFTKYGVIEAVVSNVSDDAVVDEKRGLIYRMQLLLDKSSIAVGSRQVKLKPGMSVTAEVQTGYRRIVQFFLSPIAKNVSESVHER